MSRRVLVRVLFACVVALVAAELGLRQVLGNMAQSELYTRAPADGSCVGLTPGASVTYTGWLWATPPVTLDVNDRGYRGPVVPPAADPVVAFVGDSYVYGQGVEAREAIPARLEWALRAEARLAGSAVANLGVPGFNLAESVERAERAAETLAPDLLLLAIVHNDLEPSLCSSTERFPPGWLLRRWYGFRAGFYAWKMVGGRFFGEPPRDDALDEGLAAFRGVAERAGSRAAVVVLGSPLRGRDDVITAVRRAGLPALDARAWAEPGGLGKIEGEGHFDAAGSAEAAERIAAWLVESGLI